MSDCDMFVQENSDDNYGNNAIHEAQLALTSTPFVLGGETQSPFRDIHKAVYCSPYSGQVPLKIPHDDVYVPLDSSTEREIEEATREYIGKIDRIQLKGSFSRQRLFGRVFKQYADFHVQARQPLKPFQNFCSVLAHEVPTEERVKERAFGIKWQAERWQKLDITEKNKWRTQALSLGDPADLLSLEGAEDAGRNLARLLRKQRDRAIRKHDEAVAELEKLQLEVVTFAVNTDLSGQHDFSWVSGSPRGRRYAEMLREQSWGIDTFKAVASTNTLFANPNTKTTVSKLLDIEVSGSTDWVHQHSEPSTTITAPCDRAVLRTRTRELLLQELKRVAPCLRGRVRLPNELVWDRTMEKYNLELYIGLSTLTDEAKMLLAQELRSLSKSQKKMKPERLNLIYKGLQEQLIRLQEKL